MTAVSPPPEFAAVTNHYESIDSAPARYSVNRPASVANGFLITFTALTALSMCLVMFLTHDGYITGRRDLMLFGQQHINVALPTRIFIIVFFVTYALYAYGNWWRKLAIGASLLAKFAFVLLVIDVLTWLLNELGWAQITSFGQQVASALLAMCILPHTIMRQATLPDPVVGPRAPRTPWHAYARFFTLLMVALVAASLFEQRFLQETFDLRQWAVLGGVGPGVFLVQQVFAILTAIIGIVIVKRSRRVAFAPRMAVLVPAYNEAHGIADTIAAVDRAAATYHGQVHLYIVDNNSRDKTAEVAERALEACALITGQVLHCAEPGKAIALNYGLARMKEDFVCRIDADTVIGAGCLDKVMRHFANPRIGSVGGMPLPTHERTWIDKVRLVEVLMRHGFFQISQIGYQGVLGVPGMFAVYRRSVLTEVGGFVVGMNGEDTDICLRMDTAGYHTIADPSAVYYTETPATYAHLHEQRTRWFRSIYHIAAHNRGIVLDRRSIAGAFVLPFMLANAGRRAMLLPVLIFAIFAFVVFQNTFTTLHWQPVVATVLGLPMIMAILICLLWRRADALRYIPIYLCFRLLRSYFTLTSALSLVYPPLEPVSAVRKHLLRRGA
ncbi:glycosyltransferase family 2 protein [Mycolicibacterium sp. F2034L]|uniref:glycosyltransferase n=1 Tax=Mycolicibacterium sp. F2034L TaxID=2926422 RepID=UPI001FF2250D|nr:glycosyltransferase family 2 protein [Mycolicibacterium sp. F2034L]MCK0172984.1 glycosyltransferase family 2 protein [Mycolicibacterium sp. F2034L]